MHCIPRYNTRLIINQQEFLFGLVVITLVYDVGNLRLLGRCVLSTSCSSTVSLITKSFSFAELLPAQNSGVHLSHIFLCVHRHRAVG
jgi:hypothetical protein